MHDTLLRHQDALQPADLIRYATELRLDTERFVRDLRDHAYASRVAEDVDTADLGSVSGTPTFFVNGQRHYGAYDIDSLKQAVRTARGEGGAEEGEGGRQAVRTARALVATTA